MQMSRIVKQKSEIKFKKAKIIFFLFFWRMSVEFKFRGIKKSQIADTVGH
jgi:hypothetical protein